MFRSDPNGSCDCGNNLLQLKPVQRAAEVGFGCLEQLVEMIIHQHIRMDLHPVAFDHLT